MVNKALSFIASLRMTAFLFAALLAVLLLRVILPQEAVVGKKAISEITAKSGFSDLLLNKLGMSDVTSSAIFLFVAALFYLNLVLVLLKFMRATVARIRFVPSAYTQWQNAPLKIDPTAAEEKMKSFAFDLKEIGGEAVWGVRNRYSPLGFMLFHLSFFLFLAGGTHIYFTRYVAKIGVMKDVGFEFNPEKALILRHPTVMPGTKPFTVTLNTVDAEKKEGLPTKLLTGLSFSSLGTADEQASEVNRPAHFKGFSFLPLTKDRALIFTSYDGSGVESGKFFFLTELDSGRALKALLGERLFLDIPAEGGRFEVKKGDEVVKGALEQGSRVELADGSLVLSGVTEWVSFLVVYEKGPPFLVAGFIMAVLGLSIRFIFPRQDVVIDQGRIYFRGEYFPLALRYLLYEIGADDDSF